MTEAMSELQISTSRVQDLLERACVGLPADSPFGLECSSLWIQSGLFVTVVEAEPPAMPDEPAECVTLASRETETWDFEQLDPLAMEFAASLAVLGRTMRQQSETLG